MTVEYNHEPITVEKFDRMAEEGAFGPEERVELIGGEIVAIPPIGENQSACVNRLTEFFYERFLKRETVQIRGYIVLSETSKVRPDLALLYGPTRGYNGRAPNPSDVILIIDVGETTTEHNQQKLSLYARSGISEFWRVDLNKGSISVHRDRDGSAYKEPVIAHAGEEISCAIYPDVLFSVDDIVSQTMTPDNEFKPNSDRRGSNISKNVFKRRTAI